jgi:hypothetical protein
MTRQPVTSSAVKSVGHDPDTHTLEIEFTSGKVYQHAGVSAADAAKLLAAPSIGAHYNRHISGTFAHTRIEET